MTKRSILQLLAVLACGLFAACKIQQGKASAALLRGHVYYLSGNQMPGPGRTPGKSRGVKREILIYQPTTSAGVTGQMPLFTKISTRLVARTQSNDSGYYEVKLPAGRYSVFIRDDKGFFAAEADGEGNLNLVTVSAGQNLNKDFNITLNAAY